MPTNSKHCNSRCCVAQQPVCLIDALKAPGRAGADVDHSASASSFLATRLQEFVHELVSLRLSLRFGLLNLRGRHAREPLHQNFIWLARGTGVYRPSQ